MLIVFDCDGVLVDSEVLSAAVNADLLRGEGYEISPGELAERYAGLTDREVFAAIGEERGSALPDDLLERAKTGLDVRLAAELQPVMGVHEMLDRLDGPRCICSNSSGRRLELTLKKTGLWDRFRPYVYPAYEVGTKAGKPDPNVFLHAADAFDEDPLDVLVVEDSVPGVSAAVAAGMSVVGFTGGGHSWSGHAEALMAAGALTTVARHADLAATLGALAEWRPDAA